MFRGTTIVVCLALLAACSEDIEDRASINYEPRYPAPALEDSSLLPTGAIYSENQVGLFATDRRAARIGDILTIAFTESFSATKSQNASATKSSSMDMTIPIIKAGISTSGDQSFTGAGAAAQSNSLSGRVSVNVVRVLPGGNLEILGQKRLTLNNGDEYIRVHGVVRPEDISSDNVVMSDRIAHADIKYIGAGTLADTGRPGWLTKILTAVNPL